jgi:hypothetical protein
MTLGAKLSLECPKLCPCHPSGCLPYFPFPSLCHSGYWNWCDTQVTPCNCIVCFTLDLSEWSQTQFDQTNSRSCPKNLSHYSGQWHPCFATIQDRKVGSHSPSLPFLTTLAISQTSSSLAFTLWVWSWVVSSNLRPQLRALGISCASL